MSKKDYIDAVNEIKVDENLKERLIHNTKNQKTKSRLSKIYPIASLAVACAVMMTIILPNMQQKSINNETMYETVQQTSTLPKVENFSNLHAMLKERAKEIYISDSFMESTTESMGDQALNSGLKGETSDALLKEDYSETNIQVEGVDEADIVKTDGKYIYYLTNRKLTITDVNNSNNIILSSNIEFNTKEFYPQEIFLKDDSVVIIGTAGREIEEKKINGYHSYESYTVAKVYNIQDKTNPIEERTVEVEGNYVSSRMIGDNIYLISNKYLYSHLCKKYDITELNEDDFKPKYIDTVQGEEIQTIGFDSICYIPEFEDTSYLNITAFNVKNNEPADIQTYLGAGNQAYSSTTNLYITKVKYDYNNNHQNHSVNTEIYKFSLKDATCTFVKTGTVPGSVLNQFSMDEKDGYFRIATTDSSSWNNEDDTNNLYVLNENLEIVGKVEGLAPGERIYSVRFMGNRAYMVTFVQTDPLFVIDLSEPTNPKVLGELKIPGYSKYLHPYDETHLIGIGEDTKLVNYGYGDVVTTDGMKMSLFDVTDPSNPTEMYTIKIGEKGTYSEILYNHKSLLFSKEKNIIAFPISITEENYNVTFQGAIVYGLTLEEGFKLKGKISNTATEFDRYYGKNSVERIIYIKDTFYTLSNSLIKATDMHTMETKSVLELD